MAAYYNEFDKKAAAWIGECMRAGLIPWGEIDTRSIEDVRPNDLRGFTQCHFFAGIGGWAYALRLAGWPDDRPVWTGSCPCQPFSTAGKGAAFADERHLWPAFDHLILEREPAVVLGEQVASKDADDWVDLVHADLEAMGYAFGCVAFPSASIGAPHIRDRNYWLAHRDNKRLEGRGAMRQRRSEFASGARRLAGNLEYTDCAIKDERAPVGEQSICAARNLIDEGDGAGPVNGFWRASDWIGCADGLWRPIEPGTFPLAHGVPARMDLVRGYGNAINAEQAALFIEVAMECIDNPTRK